LGVTRRHRTDLHESSNTRSRLRIRIVGVACGFAIDCRVGGGICNNAPAGDVWTFFLAHPFGVQPDPWAGGLPGAFSDKCQIQ